MTFEQWRKNNDIARVWVEMLRTKIYIQHGLEAEQLQQEQWEEAWNDLKNHMSKIEIG